MVLCCTVHAYLCVGIMACVRDDADGFISAGRGLSRCAPGSAVVYQFANHNDIDSGQL